MLLGGRTADVFGARRLTLVGLAVFTASSLLGGLAPDAAVLLAGRSPQGIGAALISPAALATVLTLFTGPGPGRGRALSVCRRVTASSRRPRHCASESWPRKRH
jgi:MFS family permease